MTPEEKLCSRWWRIRNSAWVLISILSLGMLTWAGFLYVGIRARRRAWLIAAGAFLLFFIAYVVSTGFVDVGTKEDPIRTPLTSAIGGAVLINWVAGVVLSLVANRKWLIWRAHHVKSPWYASSSAETAGPSSEEARVDDQVEAALRSPKAIATIETPTFSAAVDINTASAAELASTGIDLEWATHIVQARAKHGAFANVDQLMTTAEMPPHYFVKFRDKLTVTPRGAESPSPGRGRRLDI